MTPTNPSPRHYLTLPELQAGSGLSEPTLRRYVRDGRITAFQPGGPKGKLLFPPDALERMTPPRADAEPMTPGQPATPPQSTTAASPNARWLRRYAGSFAAPQAPTDPEN